MAAAMLSKESARAFPLLLIAFGAPLRRTRRFFLLAAVLFALRCWLAGGIGGYRDPLTGHA
jgi:hypothetical protein